MTVPEALRQILSRWQARENEIVRRLQAIDGEKIALVSLLKTIQASKQSARVAVDLATVRDSRTPNGPEVK